MTETTYFERSNLKVTDSRVISEVGVFQNGDIQRVRFYPGYMFWVTGLLLASALVVLMYLRIAGNLSALSLVTGPISIFFCVYLWVVKPTFRVKIEGTFGKATNVEFDCGTDHRCAIQLANALRRVTNINKNIGRVAGVA